MAALTRRSGRLGWLNFDWSLHADKLTIKTLIRIRNSVYSNQLTEWRCHKFLIKWTQILQMTMHFIEEVTSYFFSHSQQHQSIYLCKFKLMLRKQVLKLPKQLNLGNIFPGHYGQSLLVLKSSDVVFLNLRLNSKALGNGFFLVKEGSNQCLEQMNVVIQPNKQKNVLIGSNPPQVFQSRILSGCLVVSQQSTAQKINLSYNVEIPRIKSPKMLLDIERNVKMLKIIVNKAVSNDARIVLENLQEYSLQLEVGLLYKSKIENKENPFIIKPTSSKIVAEAKQNFMIFLNIQTNIGFGKDPRGLKKVIFRNILVLKTNSIVFWCLPIELIIIYVKQPEFKQE